MIAASIRAWPGRRRISSIPILKVIVNIEDEARENKLGKGFMADGVDGREGE
jgi:hypothetical protein